MDNQFLKIALACLKLIEKMLTDTKGGDLVNE